MMEAASTSETSVNLCQTTRRNNPEDNHLHTEVSFKWNLFMDHSKVNIVCKVDLFYLLFLIWKLNFTVV
jgi:hypothetical protein